MSNKIRNVISELLDHGIIVFVENDDLKTRSNKGSMTKHLVGLIKSNKDELVRYLSDKDGLKSAITISEAPISDSGYALSFSQQRLWLLDKIEKGSTQYIIPAALKLSGSLDVDALNEVLTTIVERHESLRTVFTDEGQGPSQFIQIASKFDLPMVNLSARLENEKSQQVDIAIAEETKKGFDLSRDLMLRGQLLKLSEDEHVLLVTMHHIASDGWSLGIMIKELSQLYPAYLKGDENPLPALEIQYADYAYWQREWLQGETLDKRLDYWQRQLSNLPVVHRLSLDMVRPKEQTFSGGLVSTQLSKASLDNLNALCLQHGATLFMGLHAAFSALLARYSDESDIVMGSPIANREQAEVEDIIGFFINTLVLRSDVSGSPTFIDLLQQSKQTALGAYSHQQISFETLVEALKPERSLSHSPLFQIMLVLQNNVLSTLELPGLTLSPIAQTQVQAKFDLTLSAEELDQGLQFEWEFNTGLFERSTIEQMAGHFISLLDNMIGNPEINVYSIAILNESERNQLLGAWNNTEVDYPHECCIHEFFEEQVNNSPDTIALQFKDQQLSYRELNSQANQLAHYLVKEKNVRPDSLVGVCLERSLEMVIAILGIVKAGGAYVPLDPDYPQSRLTYMLDDASLDTVITSSDVFARTPITSVQGLCLNELEVQRKISIQSVDNLKPSNLGLSSHHLAYVIYTSGSTGNPKGVMVEHQSIVNRIFWMHEQYGASEQDVFLQKTPFSFDVSVWEFFWPLMAGAKLVIAKPQGHTDPVYLNAQIQENGVTKLHFVPSMLSSMLSSSSLGECLSLQQVFCSGEALAINHARDFYSTLPNSELHNLYGPTEAAVDVSYWACPEKHGSYSSVPIGRPINNVQLHVLDKQLNLLPRGVVGELHIGGVGLARGYLNRTELTAEKFIQNQFSVDPDERLYKTGDLVRWLPDGNLEYVGRIDDQVKIRGFRIELGEIENTLLAHDSITETVVVAREEVGDKRIVAYVVIRDDVSENESSMDAWLQHLGKTLPDYMLPSSFVVLDALPITFNGKVDRKALPAPDIGQQQNTYVAPTTDTEKILCEIWQDILNIDHVGVTDNFFRLGGHSLLLIELLARLQEVGRYTDVHSLFRAASLRELAEQIDAAEGSTDNEFKAPENLIPESCDVITPNMLSLIMLEQASIDRIASVVPGGAANIQDVYPLVPLQEGILFHHQMSGGMGDTYVMPVLLSTKKRQQRDEFLQALKCVVSRHDVLRTIILWEDLPQAVQVVCRQVDLSITSLTLNPDADAVPQLLDLMAPDQQFIDITQAPLLRVQLAEDPEAEQYFILLQLHHIISDHVGLDIIQAEVQAILRGQEKTLTPPAPYREFVAHTLHQAQTLNFKKYFKEKLANITEPTAPFNLLDVHSVGEIAEANQLLPRTLSQHIRALSRRLAVSPAALFHTAFGLVIGVCSGRDDIVFGTVLSGRLQGTEGAGRMLGLFINTLPFRLALKGFGSEEMVLKAQSELLALLPYEQASLVLAQQCSGLPSGTPLFSALLNYRHSSPKDSGLTKSSGMDILHLHERSNYPFTVSVDDLVEDFSLTAQVDVSIDPVRVVAYLQTAIEGLVEVLESTPKKLVLDIDILSKAEQSQLLVAWNNTDTEYPKERCIHELFEEQVNRHPDAIALMFKDQKMSYSELNEKANQLAHYLVTDKCVKPDTLVGICLERSLEMVIAILGILKAGGVYVPLDPDYPSARLIYMLKDACLGTVVTNSDLLTRTPITSAQALCCDDEFFQQQVLAQSADNLIPYNFGLNSSHLAYVIYTSGSTGKPKGVMVGHQAIVNRIFWMQEQYGASQQDVFLQKTPFSFDVSVWEFFWPLMAGSQLVIAKPQGHTDPGYLNALIQEKGVTKLHFVPSMLSAMLSGSSLNECLSLKQVFCSGEALAINHVRDFFTALPYSELHNLYGPTEAAVDVSYWECPSQEITHSSVPIGRPISNVQLRVLNQQLQLVPQGVVGELYIGGVGLARGYLNREVLTAEKFIKNPFGDDLTDRLYKTGDLVRWLPDGNLEYIGRTDDQVKIRGFRIELGEIENTLLMHESISETVVVAREDVDDKRIVAYVVTGGEVTEDECQVENWRQHLGQTLPDYMLPSSFIVLDFLPLTANGKVDRKALPVPNMGLQQKIYIAPATETEEALCVIWQDILGLEEVGITDNFFRLGGHSLLAMRLMSQISHTLSVELPLKTLFEANTVQSLAVVIDELGLDSVRPTIKVASRNEPLKLSYAQQRLWFIDRLDQGSPQYNIPAALHLSGTLNRFALEQTFTTLVERHESLRTIFINTGDEPRQKVQPNSQFDLLVTDLSLQNSTVQKAAIEDAQSSEALGVFNLSRDLMLRAQLLILSETEHVLLVTMHHIASDGWSIGILVKELSHLYQAYVDGREHALPLLMIQYADYAHWQREWLQGEVLDRQVDYWKEQLFNLPVVHSLPLDKVRPRQQTFAGDNVSVQLKNTSRDRLNEICLEQGATLFMGLHAAFSVLLARYSGEVDIVMGSPIANREQVEVSDLIGFFVNMLVLRSDVSGSPSFIDLLQQSKRTALDAYAHQQVPFEQLVEVLQPERSTGHSPLFQVMLVLQNNEEDVLELPGLTLSPVAQEIPQAKFDLTLNAAETDQGLVFTWEYSTDLFERKTIERMAKNFVALVEGLMETPDENVHTCEYLSEEERDQLLIEWNDTAGAYSKESCIHELFEEQVAINENAVALVFEEQQLTYGELNAKANQLAHYLRNEKDVQPDTLVGICVERSLEMVVAILGVLKAGGAYVPLDPEYPEARLCYMLDDANLATVITNQDVFSRTPISSGQALCGDDEKIQHQISLQSCENVSANQVALTTNHLSYVIYTSGSTGKPKGVMVEHGSLSSHIKQASSIYKIGGQDNVSQFSNVAFDAASEQIFVTLCSGGALNLCPGRYLDSHEFVRWAQSSDLSVIDLPPSYALAVLPSLLGDKTFIKNSRLRLIIIGGEKFPAQLFEEWRNSELSPRCQLMNAYGPTETCITSHLNHIEEGDKNSFSHIGRIVGAGYSLVLDKGNGLVPFGVVGELCIGGARVARGYLNRSALTEEVFIQNPLNDDPSDRLYKTGDLVRWLPDGSLEYIGRLDDQVKVRGFRVELGEIENTLLTHASVNEAIVVAQEVSSNVRLVAYIVGEKNSDAMVAGEEPPTEFKAILNRHLSGSLPEYMVPAVIVLMDEFPLTPNGKVNRKALPVPDMAEQQEIYIEPRTDTEKKLSTIWQGVLGLEQVGITDNFFRLGGHSLLAMRLMSQISQTLSVELPLKTLFEASTVQSLAVVIDELGLNSVRPAIKLVSRNKPLRLSYAQQRLWFIDRLDQGSPQYNIPAALHLSGTLNRFALEQTFTSLVERHESLRTIFINAGDEPRQQVQPSCPFDLSVTNISQLNSTAQKSAIEEAQSSEALGFFDLSRDLMLRAQLLILSETEHVLLVTMHHIASDGWSIGILVKELSHLYQAYVEGREHALPSLMIQYADYAHWQREWLQGEVLDLQVDYWKERLSNLPVVHSLPLDKVRPKKQNFAGDNVTVQLKNTIRDRLNTLCLEQGATLFMGLHAAFSVLLSRYSGEVDIVMGSPIANREQVEVADLIGFFVNTLVLRSDISGNPSFIDLLQQSKQTVLDAYAHQQVPFEQLVEVLQPERSASHSPLFQVMLALQNNESDVLELPGLTLSPVAQELSQAKFDVTLNAAETDQGLVFTWEYSTDLFERKTIERMAKNFVALVEGLMEAPDENVHICEYLSDDERDQLLVEWNDTAAAYPNESCIHELFEAQVAINENAVALVFEEQQLTYGELNTKANQLAHYLRNEKGIEPDTLVGICLERSLEMVVAILGVLKAGGAYVPLDPDYPQARVAYMLGDADLGTVITSRDVLARTPVSESQSLCLDDAAVQDKILSQAHDNLTVCGIGLTSHHLAYVIYTSGSTGNPKGVQIIHNAVVNFLDVFQERLMLGVDDCWLAVTPISFDIAVLEIYLPLLSNCPVVIASSSTAKNGHSLAALIRDTGATVMQATPATWTMLQQLNEIPKLRHALVGGDVFPFALAQDMRPNMGSLLNLYGPTEATVWATIMDFPKEIGKILIGKPMNNTTVYIVSADLNPAPIGVPGELLIGGVGLARGYLNRDELTADKFIQNPFSENSNDRLYRTGDLVRWLPDGNLEYIGRMDDQVKIRGFRIELGEIENTLLTHESVNEAVVVAREDQGDKRLVAYIVSEHVDSENTFLVSRYQDEWRQHLSQTLPEHMLPSSYVVLGAFPLTPNGKTDRKALPAPDMSQLQNVYIAPSTETEKVLCAIWQDILGLEQVGVTDNFFQLGGHSLLAVRLVSMVEFQLMTTVSIRSVFESTCVKDLAAVVEEQQKQGVSVLPSIAPRASDETIPLSLIQQSYWFLYQLEEGVLYNIPLTLRLTGALNISALERSLLTLINRHENLRTHIVDSQSGPYQYVDSLEGWSLPLIDTNEIDVEALVAERSNFPFKLEREPAFRATLFCVKAQDYVLSLVSHHAMMDGWSMDILVRELSQLYDAFCSENESPLLPLSVQYGDYAVWQQKIIKGEVYEKQCDYWKEKLKGLAPLLNLPSDYTRPLVQSYRGDQCTIAISPSLSRALSDYADSQNVTLYHVLLSGMAILLSRYARTADIPLGTAIANRPQESLEHLVGCFANTVVLRCDVQSNEDFSNLVQQVKETALEAFAHADVPFDGVVEAVQPERNLGVPPIFQVMFRLHNQARGEGIEFQDMSVAPFLGEKRNTVELDLNISLAETSAGIQGEFAYATDLFTRETIERFIQHYTQLLTEAMTAPTQPIHMLGLLSAEEKGQFIRWNDTAVGYPQEDCIHALFEASAARLPGKKAYVFGDTVYSYRELNAQANKIAHWLREQGVGPEVRVGVCVGRSAWMGISLLAVLKSGGTYVPLDPNYPAERLGHMLNSVQPTLILSERAVLDRLPETSIRTVCFDRDTALWANAASDNPVALPNAEHSAYILFTSGTTGVPKGILVAHKSLRNMSLAHAQWNLLDEDARVLQFASFSFSISIWGSFMAWVAGATLCQVTDEASLAGEALYQLIDQEEITTVTWPVSLLSILPIEKIPESLTTIVSSAEPCNNDVVERWVKKGCRFLNMYGNSEVAIGSTLYEYKKSGQKLTIGSPFPNTQMYLLDEHLQPVPVGAVAEIYTGGVGLAIGYLNQPEETARKFISNPFSKDENSRLYKTGDLGRYLPNGEIEFIGREDFQVSLRGYRIELTEVETVLRQHEDLVDVAVAVHSSSDNVDYLVCFFVARKDVDIPSNTVLTEYVKGKLPSYMAPSLFIVLNEMPLTPNRKLDRLALTVPSDALFPRDRYVEPSTEAEKVLCEIWQDILGLEQVGVTDNFFQLGGHSLLAVRLVSMIELQLKTTVSIRSVFESTCVKDLAAVVEEQQKQGVSVLPSIAPRASDETIPLSLIQQSYWFLYQLEEGALYNIPLTLRLTGALNISALERSLLTLINRHENLRTHIVDSQSGPYQYVDSLEGWSLPLIDTNEIDVEALVAERSNFPFKLEREPAFRATLFCVKAQDYVLSLVSHHAMMDGWSMDILVRELSQLYDAFCSENEIPLLPLSVQYGDYAVWQQKTIKGEIYEKQCDYWKEKLKGLAPLLNLPSDYTRPPVQSYRGDQCAIAISPSLSRALSDYADSQNVTLYHVLLSGMAILLSRYARTADIPLGTAIANRPQQSLEHLVGCFANTVVLRCDVRSEDNFSSLVQQVKETALAAFAHADVPFDGVVEAVRPERSLGVPPIFQVMFRLHNQARGERIEFQDMSVAPFLGEKRNTVELDLNISLAETSAGIQGEFAYATDLFTRETIERFIQHYTQLLTEAMTAPTQPIHMLGLLSAEEKGQFIRWNDTAVGYPQEDCIHALFEASAARLPGKKAYVFGDTVYSYRELNAQANKIAHWLREQGVGPEVRVGVCVGRSAWMGISLLAVLKSGGTYVPLDPNYPAERLGHMLNSVQPMLILSECAVLDRLPVTSIRTVCFDRDTALWANAASDNPVALPNAEHSAYILFTSGTTGVPKGILVAHKSLRNMPLAHAQWNLLDEDARVLQFASFSFSISIWGSFMAWVAGATLCQVTDEASLAGEALYQLIDQEEITTVTWPVSLLSILPIEKIPESLTTIVSSAEPCNDDVVERWVKKGCRFLNMYGNSEVAIGSTLYEYKKTGQKLTIGSPFPNTQMYLLDEYLQPVPVGAVAEIYTGGVGLAIGYLNQPEETAQKFISNPFSRDENSRLYKTGDLGRYLPNGEIEFVGREDFQVSLRGYRIELTEVEATIRQSGLVEEVAVTVHTDSDNIEHLVCFFVTSEGDKIPSSDQLSDTVKRTLPSYMIPSVFIALDAMPLTPNRKLDRLALTVPKKSLLQRERYVAPLTETEKTLCGIWQKVLGLKKVGITDNFFQVGGHSLLALRLIGQVNHVYSRHFPVTELFNSPSVEAFSKIVEASVLVESLDTCLRLMKEGKPDQLPIFIVPGVGGSLLNLFELSDEISAMGSVYGLQAIGLDDGADPLLSVEEIARTNIREIQSVQAEGPYMLMGHSFGGWIVFEMARQLKSLGQDISIVLLDSPAPTEEANSHRLAYAQGKNLAEIDSLVDGLMGGGSVDKAGLSLIEQELKERIQTIARVQASIIYSPEAILTDVEVLYLRAWDQVQRYSESALQWSSFFSREIFYQDVSYDHFGMLERDSAKGILKLMQSHFTALNMLENDTP